MKCFAVVALAVSLVSAVPLKRSVTINDTFVLQFALTLENLENAFYQSGLSQFDDKAFANAGLPWFARGRAVQIGQHEAAHVAFLQAALAGQNPVQPCEYTFPFTDPVSFFQVSESLEGVGDAAYLGAAAAITDKTVLTAAASILSTEGRHAGWVNSAVRHQEPWSGAFDTPLGVNQVFTIANEFIKSCPDTNFDLGLKPFAPLKLDPATPNPGQSVKVTYSSNVAGGTQGDQFLAFLTGLTPIIVPITNGAATVPSSLQGTVYAVVTNNKTDASDASTVAGPVILDFNFNSSVSNAPASS